MKFLVTGSSGFIGGHLLRALKQAGHEGVLFDLKDQSGDVRDKQQVEQKAQGCDGVFHLAAVASVQESLQDPEGTFEHNVIGARNVFEVSEALDIPIVYASSAAIYGDNQNVPLSEQEAPAPLSPYAEYKIQNEIDAKALAVRSFGLRFFNIYGPGQDPLSSYSGVISVFYRQLQAGRPITIYGDGQQSRDFIYVEEAVQALILGMKNARFDAPVANVCTNVQNTLLQLVDCLERALDRKAHIVFAPMRRGDITHSLGHSGLLENITGFKPQIPLVDGIKKLIQDRV